MFDDLRQIVDDALSATTGWGVAAAVLILVLTWPAVRVMGWTTKTLVCLIPGVRPGPVRLVQRVVQVVVVVIAIVAALSVLNVGPGMTALAVIVAAVIAGTIVRDVVQEVSAGVGLPYWVGDQIESHGYVGTVVDIGLRHTVIETLDHRKIHLPHIDTVGDPIVVYSAFDQRRSSIEVGITYATDIETVSRLLVDALSTVEGVHQDPPPYAIPTGFADGMYLLTLRWWHDPDLGEADRIKGAVLSTVKRTLDDAGIPIPPPTGIFLSEAPKHEATT